MKLGQTIYVGSARLQSVFNGYTDNGRVKAMNNGRLLVVPAHKVSTNRRRGTGKRATSWAVGQAATVTIAGIEGAFDAEVISVKPLKARITTLDPVWSGAVIGLDNGTIEKQMEVANAE